MEIKTTNEIIGESARYIGGDIIVLSNNDKKWVAVEEILTLLNDDSITCFEDLKDTIIDELKIPA